MGLKYTAGGVRLQPCSRPGKAREGVCTWEVRQLLQDRIRIKQGVRACVRVRVHVRVCVLCRDSTGYQVLGSILVGKVKEL